MKNKNKIKLTILLLSLVQMATNGLSPMLSGVSKSFPEASAEAVQLLMTIPGIFVVVFSLLSAWLATRIEKRHLVVCGAFFVLLSGILALKFHGSIWMLWIWSGVLGSGMGLVSALVASMIPDYLEGQEKVTFMGAQTSFGNIGAMLMSIIGGGLASVAWHYNYLVFLIALPGLICGLLFLPKRPLKAEREKQSVRCRPRVWCYVITACMFLFCFNAVPTNMSMYMKEKNIGNASGTGAVMAVFLLGGVLLGLLFGRIDKRIRLYTIPAGFGCLGIGLVGIILSRTGMFLTISCLIAGMSIGFVMPQCMMMASVCAQNAAQSAMGIALVMAGSNFGTFLTPILTWIARKVTGSTSAEGRYEICAGVGFALMVLFAAGIFFEKRLKEKRASGY